MEKLIFDFRVKLYNLLYKIFKLQKINEHYHGIIEKYITKKIRIIKFFINIDNF